MSDVPYLLENAVVVDISGWVERAKNDPQAYLERQATEIVLYTASRIEPFRKHLILKGGILMGLVHGSSRQTADLDFSTTLNATHDQVDALVDSMTSAFPKIAADIGYPDLMCQIQSRRLRPRPAQFETATGPALTLKVGYARRGSPEERHFHERRAIDALEVDISFREPVGPPMVVRMDGGRSELLVYSLADLIAEKFRALLQQVSRNRYRRQDIYDITLILENIEITNNVCHEIWILFIKKCLARGLSPSVESLTDPEVVRRARADWATMALEIGEVPDFDQCYRRVEAFYRSLPWSE